MIDIDNLNVANKFNNLNKELEKINDNLKKNITDHVFIKFLF